MNDRDFEQAIRSAFRAHVDGVAPTALRGGVLAIPDVHPAPAGRRSPSGWHLPPMQLAVPIGLAAAAAIVATIIGIGLITRPTDIGNPTPLPVPSASASATPAPTPVGQPASAEMFSTLGNLMAASDSVAWVKTDTAIYRTEDAGLTWRDVQPAGWAAEQTEGFVDPDTAFVTLNGGGTVDVTHDGGLTWASTVLDGASGMGEPVFSFQSATTGFATYVDPAHFNAPDGTGLAVFATTDGGTTWIGPTQGLQPPFEASMGKLYPATGAFLVETAGKFDTKQFENWFFASDDGGTTYTKYSFPTASLAPENEMKAVDAITRDADGHLLIAIRIEGSGTTLFPDGIYRNGDDPSSWQLVAQLPYSQQALQFLSSTTWVYTSSAPSEIQSTVDAGAHWTTVTPAMSLYYFGVKWATLQTGWGMVQCQWIADSDCADARSLLLFVTTDGGVTWTQVGS